MVRCHQTFSNNRSFSYWDQSTMNQPWIIINHNNHNESTKHHPKFPGTSLVIQPLGAHFPREQQRRRCCSRCCWAPWAAPAAERPRRSRRRRRRGGRRWTWWPRGCRCDCCMPVPRERWEGEGGKGVGFDGCSWGDFYGSFTSTESITFYNHGPHCDFQGYGAPKKTMMVKCTPLVHWNLTSKWAGDGGMGGMGRLLRAIEWFAWGAGVWFGIGTR